MDQVKHYVRLLVKHRFWVLSGAIPVIGVLFWYLATAALDEQTKEYTQKLNSSFSTATQVKNVQAHPNQKSHQEMDKVIARTRNSVNDAWNRQYQAQVGVLIWPENLEEDFARAVQDLRPVESIPFPTPRDREISVALRTRYRDYIQEVLPRLAAPIGAEWRPGNDRTSGGAGYVSGGRGGEGRGDKPAEDDKYIVHWSFENQGRIAARFDWSRQAESVPKTLQILYAQEDFWVLEHLMGIIRETNGDVDARYKAAIKNIESIDLGADSAQRTGQVIRLAGAATSETPAPAAGVPPPPESSRPRVPGAADQTIDPAEMRYVDKNLQPLSAERLRKATVSLDPQEAFLVVAKRMPVRMRLLMDVRKLNRLLVECGNSKLPLEVRQVRISPPGSAAGAAASRFPGGMEGRFPSGGMPPPGVTALRGEQKQADPFLVPIEIFGIVYLYNPPSSSLGTGGANGAGASGPGPTTTGAAAPAAARPASS